MKNVIALVVTFKRKDLLSKVLDSLISQTHALHEIIIIDNNSQDGTDALVDEFIKNNPEANISYFNTGSNLGGAGGFAYGFDLIQGREYDHLWLMDDDLCPDKRCLENLLKSGNEGITQPMRLNLDGSCAEISPVIYDLSSTFLINPKKCTVKDLFDASKIDGPIEIAGIPFEGPLICRQLVEKVGKPDARFFIFNDDLDYSIRSRNAGFKIICEPKAIATRLLLNKQSNDLKSWKGYFMLRNHFYILNTHGKSCLVRWRPLVLALGYCTLSLLRGDLSTAKICIFSYNDSFALKNNDKYRP
ncbi:dTDP-rhamnosyl transferase RfbF [Enterobacteriaceae bacterium bta3-1]|nr:dTDP-rhamnosyl transferase RfbF [Enterobacteriaceae bacterium bta3-1]